MRIKLLPLLMIILFILQAGVWLQAQKVTFQEGKYQVDVMVDGHLLTSYRFAPDPAQTLVVPGVLQTKPVLFPVNSPSGTALNRTFPFAKVEGEATDHPHHQGIFFTMDQVGSKDNNFWGNSQKSLPAIQHRKILKIKEGNKKGVLKTLSHWVGINSEALLAEEREMTFQVLAKDMTAIDFYITLEALQKEVSFGDTKEGMFAFRVAQWLTEKAGGRYLNSEGAELEKGVWGKRANWVRLEGEKDGKTYGVAILSHPSGVNSPTYWHARGYGCFSVNPLGQLDFQTANKEANPKPFGLKIRTGEKALFHYRVLLYEGKRDGKEIESLYQQFRRS
jgi:hypothetical protein